MQVSWSCRIIGKGYFLNIVIYAMAAYFGAIEKAPFTAVVLISEMVGSIKHMMPLLVVTLIAYVINDWLGGRPIYAALKDEMMSSLDNPRKSAELTGLRSWFRIRLWKYIKEVEANCRGFFITHSLNFNGKQPEFNITCLKLDLGKNYGSNLDK